VLAARASPLVVETIEYIYHQELTYPPSHKISFNGPQVRAKCLTGTLADPKPPLLPVDSVGVKKSFHHREFLYPPLCLPSIRRQSSSRVVIAFHTASPISNFVIAFHTASPIWQSPIS